MVRLGIIGIGVMGRAHVETLLSGEVEGCELCAVCNRHEDKLEPYKDTLKIYTDSRELIRSGEVDAVLIATPHYEHTTIGIDALEQGLHVLVEKPISVHKADCERLIAAHKKKKQVFSAMFQMRTIPYYQRMKKLIDDGELGEIQRVSWITTKWYRPQIYYAAGGWRATWKGEGGGVLLNQCPHNLDLFQWLCGMPKRVHGFASFGKYHDIEVEDEVTAYLEYGNGATGTFITSTGEFPGTNRLEIAGDKGLLVCEDGNVSFIRNEVSARKFSEETDEMFATPDVWNVTLPTEEEGGMHRLIIQNFVDAIEKGTPLIAPAAEGIHSVELANAMLMSTWSGKPVDLPLDGKAYERRLKKAIRESTFEKKTAKPAKADLSKSFGR